MKKIMIIDPDLAQMRLLNDGLAGHFRILNCNRGAKAMELYRIFLPQAILLDPVTPGLSESGFLDKVRELPGGYRLPILALTRIDSPQLLRDIFRWKVDMVFSKPCPVEKVERKLKDLLMVSPRTLPVPAGGPDNAGI